MKSKAVSGLMLTLLFIGMLTLAFDIQPVEASGTIYIRADGSIEGTTDISSADNITYTFTANIYDSIVVERDNIVVDGAGYTVHGTGIIGIRLRNNVTLKNVEVTNFDNGIVLDGSSNNIIGNTVSNNSWGIVISGGSDNIVSENNITNNSYGILLGFPSSDNLISGNNIINNAIGIMGEYGYATSNNIISGNNIENNDHGIGLPSSKNTVISGNNITDNDKGIRLFHWFSNNNTVSGNKIANNNYGIELEYSSNNTIYHNNFVNNTGQAHLYFSFDNVWDDGYPSGGNYWSDYKERYPDAEELDGSGIWDTPYVLNADNRDHYPLMGPWPPPEHELVTSITAPAYLQLGRSSSLNATVINKGSNDETDVELELLINGTLVDSTTVTLLQAGNSYTLTYPWTPAVEGTYSVTAYAYPVSDEASVENNQMTKSVTVAVSPPSEVPVGVKAGDWIKCDYTVTGWPSGTPHPEWLKVEILGVEGTTATVRVTMYMSDGTEQSDTLSVDVVAGGGTFNTLFGFVIPANCTTGDSIVLGGDGFTFNVTIDGETTRTCAGASRTVVYASFSQYGTELTYFWDKETGVMVEASTTSGGVTGTAKATETNMWEAEPGALSGQWLWILVVVVIVVVVVAGSAVLLWRRRKGPLPEVTPTPTE